MTTTIKPASQRFAEWWLLRSKPEKATLGVVSVLLIGAIAWLTLWTPLVADIERTTQLIASQRAAVSEARREADDIASLARNTVAPVPRDARAELEAALNRQGLKPAALDRLDNDRLRVTFDAIGFDALVTMIDRLQHESKLRVVDLTATARVEPGQVRAELIISP